MNMYLVFSEFTSRPISLLASNRASAFFFILSYLCLGICSAVQIFGTKILYVHLLRCETHHASLIRFHLVTLTVSLSSEAQFSLQVDLPSHSLSQASRIISYWYCTRELSTYLLRRRPGRQVMLCACVTPLFLSWEHWSLVQRYFSHVFVAFSCATVRRIVIHLFVLSLLAVFFFFTFSVIKYYQ
jgi:hypothetical protein